LLSWQKDATFEAGPIEESVALFRKLALLQLSAEQNCQE